MITYRDVFLTPDGRARNEDGHEFSSTFNRRGLVYGVGINDFQGSVGGSGGIVWKVYKIWQSSLSRTYNPKWRDIHPTYADVSMDPSWHQFSSFMEWLFTQPYHAYNFQLDKDIIGQGKFYGPSDCIMVPPWVNSLTLDCGASRGELPIGVQRNRNGFVSQVCLGNRGKLTSKTFHDLKEAAVWYHTQKQTYLDSRKIELDIIDERLYTGLSKILYERRVKVSTNYPL